MCVYFNSLCKNNIQMCAKKIKGDDLSKKGLDAQRDGSKYEKWETGKTKQSKEIKITTKKSSKKK